MKNNLNAILKSQGVDSVADVDLLRFDPHTTFEISLKELKELEQARKRIFEIEKHLKDSLSDISKIMVLMNASDGLWEVTNRNRTILQKEKLGEDS